MVHILSPVVAHHLLQVLAEFYKYFFEGRSEKYKQLLARKEVLDHVTDIRDDDLERDYLGWENENVVVIADELIADHVDSESSTTTSSSSPPSKTSKTPVDEDTPPDPDHADARTLPQEDDERPPPYRYPPHSRFVTPPTGLTYLGAMALPPPDPGSKLMLHVRSSADNLFGKKLVENCLPFSSFVWEGYKKAVFTP